MTLPNSALNLLIFCLFIISLDNYTFSQDYSRKYLISDGLPSQEIYDLHQDKNGVIWIASDRGIASFNGSEFTSYGIIDGLTSNMVFGFFEQSDGTIWCTTRELRLFYFHPDTLKFREYKYNDLLFQVFEKRQKLEPRALKVGSDGSIKMRFLWEPGVLRVSGDGEFSFEYVDRQSLGKKQPLKINLDKDDYPFLQFADELGQEELAGFGKGMRNHLLELDNSYVRLTEYAYQIVNKKGLGLKEYVLLDDSVHVLSSGACKRGFWMGLTHSGVKVFDEAGRLKKHLAKNYSITTYLEDGDGGIWLGTHGSGLLYYATSKLKVYQPSLHTEVRSLSRDGANNLMYITNHRNVIRVDEELNHVSSEKVNWNRKLGQYYFSDRTYYDFNYQMNDKLGIIARYSDNRQLPPLFCFNREVQGSDGRTVFLMDKTKPSLMDAEFLGEELVVAYGKSVALIDDKGVPMVIKDLGVNINEIDVGNNGLIYCATRWKGVFVLNRKLQVVSQINSSHGMLGNYVFELFIDGDVLWIGTENGLSCATKQRNGGWKCDNVSLPEGLPDLQVYDIEIIGDRVYLATREGLAYFEKKDWRKIIHEETRLHFRKTKLIVNGSQRENLLNLSHDENQVEIRFDLVTFANYRKLNFRYKLKGFDDTWQVTSERRVLYHSLPAGSYEFVVQPLINEHPRREVIREKIEISSAFYNRWWFHASIWGVVILIIWLFFKYRVLNYNRGVIQEILRQVSRRLRPETNQFVVRHNGRDVRIDSEDILYVESSRNDITIYTLYSRYIVRQKISDFPEMVPDPREYLRIKRSLIIRIDKVTQKGANTVVIREEEFKVGKTYLENLKKIEL
ncbi:MAG: two-component regulator propeller domain-containing protein [Crocinitomicaceae bacterium]|nr:two-component regulator propeller domain-containing protein [Crocinitomicaceae bacterium]